MDPRLLESRQTGGSVPKYGAEHHELAPHAVGVLVMMIVFLVITLIFTVLRVCTRWTVSRRFFPSDWVFLAAEFMYLVYSAVTLVSLYNGGVGYHIKDITLTQVQFSLKLLLVIEITYALCMALLKVSICLLYTQIFPQRWVRFCAYGIMVLSACWATFTVLVGLLICRPLSASWDFGVGKCGNENAAFSSVSGVELVIDTFLILLPLPVIWRLQTTTFRKISTSSLFGLGLITIVVTGVRLHATLNVKFTDFSYEVIEIYELTIAELGVAVMVTGGMCLGPLIEKLFLPQRWQSSHGSNKPVKSWNSKFSTNANLLPSSHHSTVQTTINASPSEEMAHAAHGRQAYASMSAGDWLESDTEVGGGHGIMATREFIMKSGKL